MELPARGRTKGDLARLHDEMDDLFSSFFEGWNVPFFQRSRFPAIDIAEDENQIVVKAEVPGCQADDIDISVHGNTMTISGEKKQKQEKRAIITSKGITEVLDVPLTFLPMWTQKVSRRPARMAS